ncbi:MAG: hypothetical protein J5J00_05420 [Deltaproteobacteria bacterium]|nr:hypothetical protein [Deltaproteobacteria bacterium]
MSLSSPFNARPLIPADASALEGATIRPSANQAIAAINGEYADLQKELGHVFQSRELLREALTHTSHPDAVNSRRCLSFLGSSTLTCAAALYLYQTYSELREGELDRYRCALLSSQVLNKIAEEIGLDRLIRLGKGVDLKATRNILPKQLKAVIGAICIDSSRDCAVSVARALIARAAAHLREVANCKNDLIHYCYHTSRSRPKYEHISEGPAHAPVFTVKVVIDGECFSPCKSRRLIDGEILAAENALSELLARDANKARAVSSRNTEPSRPGPEQ